MNWRDRNQKVKRAFKDQFLAAILASRRAASNDAGTGVYEGVCRVVDRSVYLCVQPILSMDVDRAVFGRSGQ